MTRSALIVRGGWDGHMPVETTDSFIPFLEEHGFSVVIEESPDVYADAERMAGVDLIVQVVTMSTIAKEALAGLIAAVRAGTGMVGWHGGIADSYRNSADYLQLIGGQFAHHASVNPPEQATGEQSDNYEDYTVKITELGRTPPDHRGHRGLRPDDGAVLGAVRRLQRGAGHDHAGEARLRRVGPPGHVPRRVDAAVGRGAHRRLDPGPPDRDRRQPLRPHASSSAACSGPPGSR